MINFERMHRFFREESIFCFTCDIDWAPEWAIEDTLRLFSQFGRELTVFVTHPSAAIDAHFRQPGRVQQVGLHPNFLPGSSHGERFPQQIDFCQQIWPEAKFYRSHCFVDSSLIAEEFARRGFKYDSNLCLFLQPYCAPLNHWSGLMRFPVYWEDDIHYKKRLPFEFGHFKKYLEIPGLKIFNAHPLNLALNTPDHAFYQRHKFLYEVDARDDWKKYVHPKTGERDFLCELMEYLAQRAERVEPLHEIYQRMQAL